MRLTRSGLDELGASASSLASTLGNVSGGTLSVPIPTSTTSGSVSLLGFPLPYSISICPNGPSTTTTPELCEANVQIASSTLHVDAVTPHAIALSGNLPIRLQDLPLSASLIGDLAIGFGSGSCNGGTPDFDYGTFPVSVTLPIVAETIAPRAGLAKIDAANADVELTADSSALGVCKDCGTDDVICQPILDAVKTLAFDLVIGEVKSQIKAQLQTAFCTTPDASLTPPCPTGSSPDAASGATCVYDAAKTTCVPILLGTDGRLDPSSLLGGGLFASAAPTQVDFLLAAGNALNPAPSAAADNVGYTGHTPNGATLSFVGGVLPETVSPCVPAFDNPAPTNIPLPDALLTDTVSNWPKGQSGPDLGLAFSGRYLDYALGSVYRSGALCVDIKGGTVAELNTGLLSLLAPSVPSLTFEGKAATIEARLRPMTPPTITIGSGADDGANAIFTVHATDFAADLYIYSDDRYVRALTFESNVTLPIGINSGKTAKNPNGGLLPLVGTPTFDDPRVLNSELLTDSPDALAAGVSVALSALVGQLLGSNFPAIDLSSALSTFGLSLTIPQTGIRKVTQGSDDFVAIFGALTPTSGTGKRLPGTTRVQIGHLDIHPEAMTLSTVRRDLLPRLAVRFTPADTQVREYSWWIDGGPRSAWSSDAAPTLASDELIFQAKHTLWVASRVLGKPQSEEEPVSASFLVDVIPPRVAFVQTDNGGWSLSAADLVSASTDLRARARTVDAATTRGPWSEWMELAQVPAITSARGSAGLDVEVRDEAGNVGRASQTFAAANAASTTTNVDGTASDGGCSTAGGRTDGNTGGALFLAAIAGLFVASRSRRRSASIAAAALATGAAASTVACGGDTLDVTGGATSTSTTDAGAALPKTCGTDCKTQCKAALDEGLVGAYASLAQATDGTVWVSAYSDAVIKGSNVQGYGDLVVGRYDASRGAVAWSSIDGVPALAAGTCADYDPTGWRAGRTGAGDDVGLWTSLAIGAGNAPMVAYYDATHAGLKFASYDSGTSTWAVHAITPPSSAGVEDDGKYAKLAIVGGVPVVAYLFQTGSGSSGKSGVRLATAKVATPKQPSDWTIEEIASARGATDVSLPNGYPTAYGDFVTLANGTGGLAIAFYDQPNGNLIGAQKKSGAWSTLVLDGATSAGVDTGDRGMDATLTVDGNGDWHVAYVDAGSHALLYMKIPGGVPGSNVAQVVDDGSSVNGATFADGVHLIGDDARISIDGSGLPTIIYGDSTAGLLRIARAGSNVSDGGSSMFKWTLTSPTQSGRFAGIAPNLFPDGSKIANSYRAVDSTGETRGDVVFVSAN